jgi:hypothetical protein
MRRRTRQTLKKKARQHGWFIAVVAMLAIAIVIGLALSPRTESGGPWHFPQVKSE